MLSKIREINSCKNDAWRGISTADNRHNSQFVVMVLDKEFVFVQAYILEIWKNESTEAFHPYLYITTLLNSMIWIVYGIPMLNPDGTLIITFNSFGVLTQSIFLGIFSVYTKKNKYKRLIPLLLLAGGAFVGIIAAIAFNCFHTTASRMRFVGIICDIFLISMYASPLSIVYQVWRTKSVGFLPFWVCLAGFCNNICWLTYGFLKEFDLYIVIGSVVGAVFGFIQLCIYFYYAPKVKGIKY
ncbi:hypothetical protein ACS0TY_028888 [Phlomoides rotata]